MYLYGFFFFCKQKTAYELRISDWSSDVCSSYLLDNSTEFGTIRVSRSDVSSSVARMRTRRTVPSLPATEMKSPLRIGRSNSRITPDTKLLTTFCKPKPKIGRASCRERVCQYV